MADQRRSSLLLSESPSRLYVSTIDIAKHRFLSSEFETWFKSEIPLFLEIPENLFDAVQDRCKEALVLKLSLIRSAVSIELRLVADSQTQTQGYSWYPRQLIVARVKNVKVAHTRLPSVGFRS